MLNSHEAIELGNERILDYSRQCQGKCTWAQTQAEIESHMHAYHRRNSESVSVIGFNIQYDQIHDSMRKDFAHWAHCNQVAVIHLIRSASVESFWTMQAQLYDTMQLRGYVDSTHSKVLASKLKSNQVGINVDPTQAVRYVKGLEAVKRQFRHLLHFHPRGVHYMELFYEDLLLPSANLYWRMVQAFLGVTPVHLKTGLQRLHPGSCSTKVRNWDEVRQTLKGTDAELACRRVYTRENSTLLQ